VVQEDDPKTIQSDKRTQLTRQLSKKRPPTPPHLPILNPKTASWQELFSIVTPPPLPPDLKRNPLASVTHQQSNTTTERLRTESWETTVPRLKFPLLDPPSLSSTLASGPPSVTTALAAPVSVTTSSRILWLLGDTPKTVLEITEKGCDDDDELETGGGESDDDQFYLSHIDRYPSEAHDREGEGNFFLLDSEGESWETTSVTSSTGSFVSSLLSDTCHEEGDEDDDEEEEEAKKVRADDGFEAEGVHGVQFIQRGDAGGGYRGHCQIGLRCQLPNPSPLSSAEFSPQWRDVWTAYSLASVSSPPLGQTLSPIPHTTLDLRRLLLEEQRSGSEPPQLVLPAQTLSAVITRQEMNEPLPSSCSSPSPGSVRETPSVAPTTSGRQLTMSSPLRQSKSLSSLSSLLLRERGTKATPSLPSSRDQQERAAAGPPRRRWVIQLLQSLPHPSSASFEPLLGDSPFVSVIATLPLAESSTPGDYSLSLSVSHSSAMVSCALQPIRLSLQAPVAALLTGEPELSMSLQREEEEEEAPRSCSAGSASVSGSRRKRSGSGGREEKALSRRKKIQRAKVWLGYGCGGLLTFLLCCFLLFISVTHVRRTSSTLARDL
jgi:hypothetical protein